MAGVLGLDQTQMRDLIEISSFIFEQAAYVQVISFLISQFPIYRFLIRTFQLTLPQMKDQLEGAGLQVDQVKCSSLDSLSTFAVV